MHQPHSTESTIETSAIAQKVFHILLERIRLIALCVAIISGIAAAYCWWAPSLYDAITTVQVNQSANNLLDIQDIQNQDLNKPDLLQTIATNIPNLTVLRRVVKRLELTPDDLYLPKQPPGYYTTDALAGYLYNSVFVILVRNTRLIQVIGESRDPRLAQKISVTVVDEYLAQRAEEEAGVSAGSAAILRKQADQLATKLKESEQALQDYKETHEAVSLETTQNITVEELKALSEKMTHATTDRFKLEADYAQVQRIGERDPAKLLSIESIARSLDVLEQKKKVSEQEAEIANFSKRYGPLHPKLIQAKSQLAESREGLNRAILGAAAALGNTYESAKQAGEKYAEALAAQERDALALNKIAIPYNVLQREVESDKALYDAVLKRMKETDTTKDSRAEEIRVVDLATVPAAPAKPRTKLILALAIVGSLGFGVGLAFLLSMLDSSFKTVDEAEADLGLPAVGALPQAHLPRRIGSLPVIVGAPESDVAEGIRTLRTSLSLLEEETPHSTILFTSAAPGEGKSFCASNYAASLAQQHQRVLLIDADLRVPLVGKMFGLGNKAQGVSDYVEGRARLRDAVRKTEIDGLFILPAGQLVRNPTELLDKPGFGFLIEEAENEFDRVVVDSAPIHAVSDTLLVARHIPSVCLVVQAGKTPKKAVVRALQKLAEANARPLGFILNRLPRRVGNYFYRYGGGEKYGVHAYSSVESPAA